MLDQTIIIGEIDEGNDLLDEFKTNANKNTCEAKFINFKEEEL
jgi:hypothetical protein